MKYIKKFESKEDVDIDYIEMCFIEFIDDGAHYSSDYVSNNNCYNSAKVNFEVLFEINISFVTIEKDYNGEFSDYKTDIKNLVDDYTETLANLDSCVERIKLRYDNLIFFIESDSIDYICLQIRKLK